MASCVWCLLCINYRAELCLPPALPSLSLALLFLWGLQGLQRVREPGWDKVLFLLIPTLKYYLLWIIWDYLSLFSPGDLKPGKCSGLQWELPCHGMVLTFPKPSRWAQGLLPPAQSRGSVLHRNALPMVNLILTPGSQHCGLYKLFSPSNSLIQGWESEWSAIDCSVKHSIRADYLKEKNGKLEFIFLCH